MQPSRKLKLGLVAACALAAGLALFVGLHEPFPVPENSTTRDDHASPGRASEISSPVDESHRGPAVQAGAKDEWITRWEILNARSEDLERNGEMIMMLEELGASDAMRALALAEAESDPVLRNKFLEAALRGWGRTNPAAAIAWTKAQSLMDQGLAMSAVFHGAAHNPEEVVRLAAQLSGQDPEHAGDYGSYLISALSRAGEFNRAALFAEEAPAEIRVDLLNAAYAAWGGRDPQAALQFIEETTDSEMKTMAFNAAISAWANHDGKAVAEYAFDLPAGPGKTFALSVALRAWASTDLVAAATWMGSKDASPEFDLGAAVAATLPDAAQLPRFATTMAENITDAGLRTRVLATIVQQWAVTDPVAARAYAENSPTIRPEERPAVLAAFSPDFSPVSLVP